MTDRELMQQAFDAMSYGNANEREAVRLALRDRLAQPEQEPVAWIYRDSWGTMKLSQVTPPPVGAFPVYTTPPQRKPLTDEDLRKLADKHLFYQPEGYEVSGVFALARAIEAAHGIKGEARGNDAA